MAKYSKRSGEAVAAMHRNGGPMRHRLAGRGNARSRARAEYLAEYAAEHGGAHPDDEPMLDYIWDDGSQY